MSDKTPRQITEQANIHIEHYFPKGYDPDKEPWKSIKSFHESAINSAQHRRGSMVSRKLKHLEEAYAKGFKHGASKLLMDSEQEIEALKLRAAQASEHGKLMREFVGWLSGDIPELHSVEVPRLAESLERFLKAK
jgi:hypothetical protein